MKTSVKAIYKGKHDIKLLEDIELDVGAELELIFDIPDLPESKNAKLGQSIVRGLKDVISGRVRVIKNAHELESWSEELRFCKIDEQKHLY